MTSETMVMYWKSILIPGQQTLKETDGRQVRKIYVTTAEKTVGVETKIVQSIAALGFKNRGVKRNEFHSNLQSEGGGRIFRGLLEVCFIDDKDDMSIYAAKKRRLQQP